MFELQFRDVSLQESRRIFLDDLQCQFPSGSSVAITGPSRSGKTSLLLLAGGYLRPTNGSVLLVENDQHLSLKPDLIGIGPIHGIAPLFETLTIEEQILMQARLYRVRNAKKRVQELLLQWNLSDVRKKRIKDVDRYIRFRTGVASALVHQPRVLLLDEPERGLTSPEWEEAWGSLCQLREEDHVITIMTTLLEETMQRCDFAIELPEGRVIHHERLDHRTNRVETTSAQPDRSAGTVSGRVYSTSI